MNHALEKFHSLRWWVGIVACGLGGGLGNFTGQFVGHPSWGAAVGGGIGGFVLLLVTRRASRHERPAPGRNDPGVH